MEILSDRYFMMNETATSEGRFWYAEKPYLAQSRLAEGKIFVDFYAENGLFTMEFDLFDEFIYEWDLIEVDAYRCPCCSGYSFDYINDTRDKHEPNYHIEDGTIHITDHFFGTFCEFKVNNCPICGGKV